MLLFSSKLSAVVSYAQNGPNFMATTTRDYERRLQLHVLVYPPALRHCGLVLRGMASCTIGLLFESKLRHVTTSVTKSHYQGVVLAVLSHDVSYTTISRICDGSY